MRIAAAVLGLVLPVFARCAEAEASTPGLVLELEGARFAAAEPPAIPPGRAQDKLVELRQWTYKNESYFYDVSGDRRSGWGLKFTRMNAQAPSWARPADEAYTASNVGIFAGLCVVRHLAGLERWADPWGRIHSIAALEAQAVFNCEVRRFTQRQNDREDIWKDFNRFYSTVSLPKALSPEPPPWTVRETGLLDRETLKIPCRRLRMRRAHLQARLLVECAQSTGQPCRDSSMLDASLGFFQEVLDTVREAIEACESPAQSVPMAPGTAVHGTPPFGMDALSGLKNLPLPPLSDSDQKAFDRGAYTLLPEWQASHEAQVKEFVDPSELTAGQWEAIQAAQSRAKDAIDAAEEAAQLLWGIDKSR